MHIHNTRMHTCKAVVGLQSPNMHEPHFVVYSRFYVFYNYNLIFQNMYSLTFSLWCWVPSGIFIKRFEVCMTWMSDFWLVFFMSLSAVMWLKKTVFTLLSVEYENCMLLLTFDIFIIIFLVYNFAFASLSFPHFTHAQQNIDILCTYSSYCDIHYISLYGCLWHCVRIFYFF